MHWQHSAEFTPFQEPCPPLVAPLWRSILRARKKESQSCLINVLFSFWVNSSQLLNLSILPTYSLTFCSSYYSCLHDVNIPTQPVFNHRFLAVSRRSQLGTEGVSSVVNSLYFYTLTSSFFSLSPHPLFSSHLLSNWLGLTEQYSHPPS